MKSLFVTGTDTDVGKTFVTAGIVRGLVDEGINSVPAKPVQTGCVNDFPEDLEFALKVAELHLAIIEKRALSPIRFAPACSPHLAAELAGIRLDHRKMAASLKNLRKKYSCVVAEGAGGVLVPLGNGKTMVDLMTQLEWPVVLVSTGKLGTINHTLLSLRVLQNAGLHVAGVVINHVSPPSQLFNASNIQAISEYGNVEILGEIPYSPESFPADSFKEVCKKLKGILSDELQKY